MAGRPMFISDPQERKLVQWVREEEQSRHFHNREDVKNQVCVFLNFLAGITQFEFIVHPFCLNHGY